MRKLRKPDDEAKSTFLICISRVRDINLKTRLTSIADIIDDSAISYDTLAANGELYKSLRHDNVNNTVTKAEMTKIYDWRMVSNKSPGRNIYDKLKTMPKHGKCPFCGQRTVSTLDHYLPKDLYPVYVVTPVNLIAACSDCNKVKRNIDSNTPEEQTIHPYYDDVTTETWLFATVVESNPAYISFYVDPPDNWDNILKSRIEFHFDTLELGNLFVSHAASELANIKHKLDNLFMSAGCKAVKDHLVEEAATHRSVHMNSWQLAMYQALSESDWYCDGGFRNV